MTNALIKIKNVVTNSIFLSILMSVFTYITFCIDGVLLAYSVASWLIFFSIITLYIKTNLQNKILKKEVIVLSLIFSFITVFGKICYDLQGNIELSVFREFLKFHSFIKWIGYFNLIYILLTNLLPLLYKFKFKQEEGKKKSSWKLFFTFGIIIFLCWLPYFLAFYPGTLSSDSISELTIVINHFSSISDHHPVIHMLFISIPYNIGFWISKSTTIAIALTTICQMIVMASIFSSFLLFLYNRKVNYLFIILSLLFYALVPMHGYYSIVMWKDVIFSGLMLLLTMETIKIIEKEKKNLLGIKHLIPFIIVSTLCIFFRNNAIYMYMVLTILTFVFFKKYYKVFIPVFLIVYGIYFIVKGPIFNYLHVEKSPSAEYIGIPLQQIGRMAFKNITFTEEEEALINQLIPVEVMRVAYDPKLSDGIKFNKNYNKKAFDKQKADYFKLWLNLVKKHPSIAVEAYSISTLGYWYPGVAHWSVVNSVWENDYGIETDSKVPKIIKQYLEKIESRNTPIYSMEWSIGLCFWLILIFGCIAFKKEGLKSLYVYTPIFGIWITMMIASPVYGEFRYVYSAFTCLPLLMLFPYFNIKVNKRIVEDKNEKSR